MSPSAKSILERVAAWPEKDQEELAEIAREIEARRTGIYELTAEEQAAIHEDARLPSLHTVTRASDFAACRADGGDLHGAEEVNRPCGP